MIAKHTEKEPILSKLLDIVRSGKKWILKSTTNKLRTFEPILDEVTISGNNILLKSDRIILPEVLQKKVLKLAHKGSHPGISSMERRLRKHFFFHNMQSKATDFANSCNGYKVFVEKKNKIAKSNVKKLGNSSGRSIGSNAFIQPFSRCTELGSRYPAAKLVSSARVESVIQLLKTFTTTMVDQKHKY